MIINSLLPPTSLQSPVSGQWYIVTTDPKLGWVPVDRKYEWEELNKMWNRVTYGITKKLNPNVSKQTLKSKVVKVMFIR